jgi:glycosyltransferase involved in cell wall biosynthesis
MTLPAPRVSVIVPTFRRPEGCRRAVLALLAQDCTVPFEIVVVDNDPHASATAVIAALVRAGGSRVIGVAEPRAGVSNARNAGLARARGALIAFLDDDQEPPSHWLATLVDALGILRVDAAFGPVEARLPAAHALSAGASGWLASLYTRTGPDETRVIARAHGCGNALIRRDALPAPLPFDAAANETGGEDDLVFAAMAARGARFGWAHRAGVIEHLDPARARLGHALRRAFAYGQGPAELAWARRDLVGLARWTAIGAAQAAVFGTLAAGAAVLGRPGRWRLLERAVMGAGKLAWFLPQRFYGAAALR